MNKKIRLSKHNKVLAGVCGGVGEYFNIDPTFVRIAWVLATLVRPGTLTATVDMEPIVSDTLVLKEKDVTFTAIPCDGYTVKRWALQGEDIPNSNFNSYMIEELSFDAVVTVEFEKL